MTVPSMADIINAFIKIDEKRIKQNGELFPTDYAYWVSLKDFIETHFDKIKCGDKSILERRNSIRIPVYLRVDFQSKEQFGRAYISNLGEGGVSIESEFPLNTGSVVLIKIYLNNKSQLEVKGRVVWLSQETGKPGHWRLGIKFVNLTKDLKQKLSEFVYSTLQEIKP